jgi:branched-chain amino acid transport system permease protein
MEEFAQGERVRRARKKVHGKRWPAEQARARQGKRWADRRHRRRQLDPARAGTGNWWRYPASHLPTLAVVALIAWPFVFGSSYDLRVFALAGIFAINTLGFQFIFGHAGALALTQGTFFGIGAYVTALTALDLGFGFGLTMPLSIIVPVLLALVIAAPVLRLESHYFALATLGIGQVVLLIAIQWEPFTGGANGRPGVPGVTFLGLALPRGLPFTLFVWGFVFIAAALAWQMMKGLVGRAYMVMRENDIAAMSMGIDIWRLRLVAFLWSAAYGGLAGALYVHTVRVISPEVLEFHIMVGALTMAVLGGRTHVAGAILGAFLLVHLPEWFRTLDKYYLIAYGAVLLAAIILAPEGMVGRLARLRAPATKGKRAAPPVAALHGVRSAQPLFASEPVLEVKDVSIAFGGVRALDRVSLSIGLGEIFGLIGPNGSGKTTLVNCITRMYTPEAGAIRFVGRDMVGLRPYEVARLGVARTFQNLNLVDDMSALDNVATARYTLEEASVSNAFATFSDRRLAKAREHAMHLLESMDVAQFALRPCGGLPYGVKRRVEIARALALEPRLLLLDEPAAGLNDAEQLDLAERLRRLADQRLTLLVIEHNMPFLMPLATRMACLDHGQVIATGTPEEIRENPLVIEAYLGTEEHREEKT